MVQWTPRDASTIGRKHSAFVKMVWWSSETTRTHNCQNTRLSLMQNRSTVLFVEKFEAKNRDFPCPRYRSPILNAPPYPRKKSALLLLDPVSQEPICREGLVARREGRVEPFVAMGYGGKVVGEGGRRQIRGRRQVVSTHKVFLKVYPFFVCVFFGSLMKCREFHESRSIPFDNGTDNDDKRVDAISPLLQSDVMVNAQGKWLGGGRNRGCEWIPLGTKWAVPLARRLATCKLSDPIPARRLQTDTPHTSFFSCGLHI